MSSAGKMRRWRGLVSLVRDVVEHGSHAVERIQKETAARPFTILESIPGIAEPARLVHVIHDVSVSGVHGAIRAVNRGVAGAVDVVLDTVEHRPHEEGEREADRDAPPPPSSPNARSGT